MIRYYYSVSSLTLNHIPSYDAGPFPPPPPLLPTSPLDSPLSAFTYQLVFYKNRRSFVHQLPIMSHYMAPGLLYILPVFVTVLKNDLVVWMLYK